MADRSFTPPPRTGGIARGLARGKPVVKPKNLRGTMLRLWKLTRGSRKGLGDVYKRQPVTVPPCWTKYTGERRKLTVWII